jgi:molecular chaperone HtpG
LAAAALELPAFRAVQLLRIKDEVAEALSLIGREGLFSDYTKHDISHVDGMLGLLDELVPPDAATAVSPADWLMVVLAIYFHDLGMLVTTEEFASRDKEQLHEFCERELFTDEAGPDYRAKVETLGEEQAERFFYQEFVRARHPQRIRAWLTGDNRPDLGAATRIADAVHGLVEDFPLAFREDLALVCESHHREDLGDTDKYQVSRPYGQSPDEAANVQYAALLLRTCDLLHITQDRTPSILFRTIAPADPVSQTEWVKQMAVTAVRSKPATDSEGVIDVDLPRDTIEVYADFPDDVGFFALTTYLRYANAQLRQNFDWSEAARQKRGSKHVYRWQRVDDEHVRAKGYLKEIFEFSIDQARVLDLLTGHTLYNDTRVVLRELIQNSLDAVRVQGMSDKTAGRGHIEVRFDSNARTLTVKDDGTGMTQQVIRDHLLRVGASRYQGADFRKAYPDFVPISRFGIGVLSCFMVADSVQITTCHPDEEQARRLKLRDVHGRYLVEPLEKAADDRARALRPHGTLFELSLRPSAELEDVAEVVRRWVVLPRCDVIVQIDEGEPVAVGHETVGSALIDILEATGFSVDDERLRVEEFALEGLELAVATRWSEFFREWQFLQAPRDDPGRQPVLGTCVEGIRVELTTPAFDDTPFYALANATGASAPRTNVARSGLEATEERQDMLRKAYTLYCQQIESELRALTGERGFSLTWAAREGTWLVEPLEMGRPTDFRLLRDTAGDLPLVVLDQENRRTLATLRDIAGLEEFWTIDSAFFRSIEALLREVPSSVSLPALEQAFGAGTFELPSGPVVSGIDPPNSFTSAVFDERAVTHLKLLPEQRRVDLRWSVVETAPWWYVGRNLARRNYQLWEYVTTSFGRHRHVPAFRRSLHADQVAIALDSSVTVEGADSYVGATAQDASYLFDGTPVVQYARQVKEMSDTKAAQVDADAVEAILLGCLLISATRPARDPADYIDNFVASLSSIKLFDPAEVLSPYGGIEALRTAFIDTAWEIFDPRAWQRSG